MPRRAPRWPGTVWYLGRQARGLIAACCGGFSW
jgi:hypothetical protein